MNRLELEQSPYLLQHAQNPVDWYPWGQEAFARARQQSKPVFLSIGYSTCHWCHVMARESFEDPGIAALLNEHFISIKVDREERPDIDQIYMASVLAMTGQGGWPLSVFLTPDKMPFYGGTYFPPIAKWGSVGFRDLLSAIAQAWQKDPAEVIASSSSLTGSLKRRFTVATDERGLSGVQLDQMFHILKSQFDDFNGGFGQSPKFPMGHNLSLLLRYWYRTGNKAALNMVVQTLRCMARGGIYDQFGGGFHRYSTDPNWHLPHFEKMLYDQALLVRPYIEAHLITGEQFFAEIARETLDYVLREMCDPQGGFYSAQDADSVDAADNEHKEGAYYVWSDEEIEKTLGSQSSAIIRYHFGIKPSGNVTHDPHGEFGGKNVVYIEHTPEETAHHFKKDLSEVRRIIDDAKRRLASAREKRPRPFLDDKVMTDWNGLMISAFAHAGQAFCEERYIHTARKATDFILKTMVTPEGRLLHRFRNSTAGILGTLEDYAFFILGLLDLYEATFELAYFEKASILTDRMIDLFADRVNGGFFLTGHDAEELIVRVKEVYDGAVPSGNSAAAMVLARFYHMTGLGIYREILDQTMRAFASAVAGHPEAHCFFLAAFDFSRGPVDEIILSGPHERPEFKEMLNVIFRAFRPYKVVAANPRSGFSGSDAVSLMPMLDGRLSDGSGPVRVYVCRDNTCLHPAVNAQELQSQLQKAEVGPEVAI